jgi:DNA invertase Pin-like site-specific DNA recombinase
MVGFMAVMAESEGRRISERTRDALAQARRRGTELGGRRSTTWDRGDEGPEEAAARSAAVRRARADEWAEGLRRVVEELRAEGRTSLREIARGLEERRRLTPRRSATWTPTTVRRLLARLEGGS